MVPLFSVQYIFKIRPLILYIVLAVSKRASRQLLPIGGSLSLSFNRHMKNIKVLRFASLNLNKKSS